MVLADSTRAAYLAVPLFTVLVQAVLSYWVARHWWHQRGARTFFVMSLAGGLWALETFLFVWIQDPGLQAFLLYSRMVVGFAAVSAFVVFASVYTGAGFHRDRLAQVVIVGLPLLVAVLALATPVANLLFESVVLVSEPFVYLRYTPKPLYFTLFAISTGLAVYADFVIVWSLLSTRRGSGWQLALLIVGGLSVTALEVLGQIGVFPIQGGFSHAPYGLAIFFTLTAVALFTFDLFYVKPVARSDIVETLRDPVVVLDASRRLIDYNVRARELWPAVARATGTPFENACPSLAAAIDYSDFGAAERTQTVALDLGDDQRHFSIRIDPIERGPRASDQWFAVVLRDISDLERSRWQLRRQNERLDQVAATISHDLRTPIQLGRGHLRMLREDLQSEPLPRARMESIEDNLSTVDRAFERMETIIDDLLSVARHGNMVESKEPLDLETVAAEAWEHVAAAEGSLVVDPGTVEGDRTRLLTIFENLFRNAVEHAGPSPTIEVRPHPRGFSVSDDGPGIPADRADSVFDFGYTDSSSGTGLGLSIVRTMAESQGWSVTLETAASGGARFVFDTSPTTDSTA
jgi:signal transduction histidine kinase